MGLEDLVFQPDHVGVAVDERLLSQWRNKPRIRALTSALATGVQTAETEIFDVHVATQFDAASGADLDQWGEYVGEARDGLSDIDYRVFINAKVLANNTVGQTDELIRIFDLLTSPNFGVTHRALQPLTNVFQVVRSDFMGVDRARRVSQLMETIRPGGVAFFLIESSLGYFGFDEDPESLGLDIGTYSRQL